MDGHMYNRPYDRLKVDEPSSVSNSKPWVASKRVKSFIVIVGVVVIFIVVTGIMTARFVTMQSTFEKMTEEVKKMKNRTEQLENIIAEKVEAIKDVQQLKFDTENQTRILQDQYKHMVMELQRIKSDSQNNQTNTLVKAVQEQCENTRQEAAKGHDELTEKNKVMNRIIQQMKADIDSMNRSSLLGALQEQLKRSRQVEGQLQNKTKDIEEELQTTKQVTKQQQDKLQDEFEVIREGLQNVTDDSKIFESSMKDHINKLNTTVTFTAYLDKAGALYPNNGDVIPFNKIVTNIGADFNTATGKFRCPVRGIYAFWFSLYASTLKSSAKIRTSGQLLMDSRKLSESFCYNSNSNAVSMKCGNNAVAVCERGSEVWVQSEHDDTKVYGTSDKETTFTGFLIRQL